MKKVLDIYKDRRIIRTMDIEDLIEMMMDDVIECECCGASIEPDGVCPEGTPSPLLTAGLI